MTFEEILNELRSAIINELPDYDEFTIEELHKKLCEPTCYSRYKKLGSETLVAGKLHEVLVMIWDAVTLEYINRNDL